MGLAQTEIFGVENCVAGSNTITANEKRHGLTTTALHLAPTAAKTCNKAQRPGKSFPESAIDLLSFTASLRFHLALSFTCIISSDEVYHRDVCRLMDISVNLQWSIFQCPGLLIPIFVHLCIKQTNKFIRILKFFCQYVSYSRNTFYSIQFVIHNVAWCQIPKFFFGILSFSSLFKFEELSFFIKIFSLSCFSVPFWPFDLFIIGHSSNLLSHYVFIEKYFQ